MFKKIMILGTVLAIGANFAEASQQQVERAAVGALFNSSTVVRNEEGTALSQNARDVAFNMTIGTGPGVAKPTPGEARRVRVNAPCVKVQDSEYKCAYCVSYKEGQQYK